MDNYGRGHICARANVDHEFDLLNDLMNDLEFDLMNDLEFDLQFELEFDLRNGLVCANQRSSYPERFCRIRRSIVRTGVRSQERPGLR